MVQLKDFEILVHESAAALAKIVVQDQRESPENKLLPTAAKEQKLQNELVSHVKKMQIKMLLMVKRERNVIKARWIYGIYSVI